MRLRSTGCLPIMFCTRPLASLGTPLDAVLLFEVDEEELVRRLSGRTTCDACQRPYLGRAPGEPCTECAHTPAGTLVRRKDDEPEAIRTRMQVYRDQTAPVVDWYGTHGARMVPIDALGTLEEVEARAKRLDRQQRAAEADMYRWASETLSRLRAERAS